MNTNIRKILKNYWIYILIISQPLLDLLAYFTSSQSGTISGLIRLFFMVFLVIFIFIFKKPSKKFIIVISILLFYFVLHFINGFRVGYLNPISDISYAAKVAYMPVVAVCLTILFRSDDYEGKTILGFNVNLLIIILVLILSYITDSYTATYEGYIGISGWVPDSNRCCHSDILATLCIFAALTIFTSRNNLIKFVGLPVLFVLLITNGTRSCYGTLLIITVGYPLYLIIECIIKKIKFDKIKLIICAISISLFVLAFIIYPITPRHEMDTKRNYQLEKVEKDFADKISSLGYDAYSVSKEELAEDPNLKSEFSDYYLRMTYSSLPILVETYGTDRIMQAMNYTIESSKLADTRVMKKLYASFIFADSDIISKLLGFEIGRLGDQNSADLENDWFALFYYYGYLGFGLYILGIIILVIRIIKKFFINFSENFTIFSFTIYICFFIQLGLGYFSGAILRRPNASIYLSIVISMIYLNTQIKQIGSEGK